MRQDEFIDRQERAGDRMWRSQHGRNGRVLTDDLAFEVLAVVSEIPEGRVATYGQVARLIGRPKNSRLVGKILSRAEYYGDYPCHRVVNHAGRLAPGFDEQRARLEAEGVGFRDQDHVDVRHFQWGT